MSNIRLFSPAKRCTGSADDTKSKFGIFNLEIIKTSLASGSTDDERNEDEDDNNDDDDDDGGDGSDESFSVKQ